MKRQVGEVHSHPLGNETLAKPVGKKAANSPTSSSAYAQRGHGAKGSMAGSPTLKGNRNKGRARRSRGTSKAQSQGGRSRPTNSDIARDAARDLVFSMHPHRGRML